MWTYLPVRRDVLFISYTILVVITLVEVNYNQSFKVNAQQIVGNGPFGIGNIDGSQPTSSNIGASTPIPTIQQQQQQQQQQPCDRSRRVFTVQYGEISDGPAESNYTQDSHCEWLIKAKNESQFITLTFRSMGTECSYDYIFVYDGDSFKSPLLGSFSGKTAPQQLIAKSGSMLILLYSDTNYVLEGFKAEFTVSNCPNNCTNRGKCVGHRCVCQGDWIGRDCSEHACPDGCGVVEGRGICSKDHCRCFQGFSGKSCSLNAIEPNGNQWHWISNSQEGLTPRAAHTAVYVEETDSLYVFGGYDLNNILSSLQVYSFQQNEWQDEWGISLRNRHYSKIDNTLLKAVLYQNQHEQSAWGLKTDASFFRNILLSLSDGDTTVRRSRSPNPNETSIIDAVFEQVSPTERYGHAAAVVPGGFVIFGGKLANGSLSNELWYYNVSETGYWSMLGINSKFQPPGLTRHTIAYANDWIYLFGGSLDSGEFSSTLYRIKINNGEAKEQWEEVKLRGGKSLDVRVVAHSMTYHPESNSLIVYGGIVAGVARFSKLSDRMFAFHLEELYWTEISYPRTPLRDAHVPRERAFHTATLAGNYLIIFGGYTHRHNKEEICYDNQMYLYHLGCHTWVNQDVLGINSGSTYPKQQGVFAHAATLRLRHTLMIVGGYHGNVNADLLAYTLPLMMIVKSSETFDPEALCVNHITVTECISDPECGWCSADTTCYGRTIGANCTTNLQTTRCPGICPALGDCRSCLIHGGKTTRKHLSSVVNKLRLDKCAWCVENARCHHMDDNYGVCGEDTPSLEPGWWGEEGNEIKNANECALKDKRPGLTYVKYLNPVNWTLPDDVAIVNATMVDFMVPSITSTHIDQTHHGEIVARLLGFIRPPKSWEKAGETLHVCASYAQAVLRLAESSSLNETNVVANITAEQTKCILAKWPALENKFLVDYQATRLQNIGSSINHYQHSKMGLQHNRSQLGDSRAFTFEYLEPYVNGNCEQYYNCHQCLIDSSCGWCDLTNQCVSRSRNESESCRLLQSDDEAFDVVSTWESDSWRYLTLQPSQCANCSNFISCEQCLDSGICEWWADEAKCVRLGRSTAAVRSTDECPAPCYTRQNCSSCLETSGRCVWCEATQQCFSFSVYTSEYQFGICREWLDQVVSIQHTETSDMDTLQPSRQQCKTCSSHRNCSICLQSLSCGWCFDRDNPIEGLCMQGDFNRSIEDCAARLNTSKEEAEWAYAQCPDVDECGLGLHDCHKEAKCTNTHGSYNCHCRRGFVGDGRTACIKTCYESCVNGHCSGTPDYVCNCDLGWTGADCSINCGCNNHSTCEEKLGKCDSCQNWTEGEFCERCRPGSYGNASSPTGCKPCECNGHGNQGLGICDVETGECYCQDNTEGLKCEACNKKFYGDPRDGGQCYFQCEARGMLTQVARLGIGSFQSHTNLWGGTETFECLWIISPHGSNGTSLNDALIQLEIQPNDLNVTCGENAVYVYDGLPDLTGNSYQNQLIGVFCNEDTNKRWKVEGRSGHVSVHYKQGHSTQGFNAMYDVKSCSAGTCGSPHICNTKGKCVCPPGLHGVNCDIERCPRNCHTDMGQGICDKNYGRCICTPGFAGRDCGAKVRPEQIEISELFNSQLISDGLDHLRKTLPRFGHSLAADKRGSLWMFGGYSLSHGALNDIRQFDTKNSSWMQVTVDSTAEAKMPLGRYFHAADIVHIQQMIYIYGGLRSIEERPKIHSETQHNHVLDDLWQFSIANQRWDEVELTDTSIKPPPLAGHTMTYIKQDNLLIIGGFSPKNGLENHLWTLNLVSLKWNRLASKGKGPNGIIGHSTAHHITTHTLYIFGGYEFIDNRTKLINKLYTFNYDTLTWTVLPEFTEFGSGTVIVPQPRFLHSAISSDEFMLIYGGRSVENRNITNEMIFAYNYKCNQWIPLMEGNEIAGQRPTVTYGQAMILDPEIKDVVYVIGGWDGNAHSRVIRLDLPSDLCSLWSIGKNYCRHYMGCSYCAIKSAEEKGSACYTTGHTQACSGFNGTIIFNEGIECDANWISKRNCSSFSSCSTCLATYPIHGEHMPICRWCKSCDDERRGKCIDVSKACDSNDSRCIDETVEDIEEISLCPEAKCLAPDCESCKDLGEICEWAYDGDNWGCHDADHTEKFNFRVLEKCHRRCSAFTNCTSCLGTNEDRENCRWSTQLNQCISTNYQPLYCAAGVCGLVLEPSEAEHCPEPCQSYTQCATCLRHAHCGWCSRDNTNGDGVCTEGSLESPSEYPAASTCDIIYASHLQLDTVNPNETFTWNYIRCPMENECINQHHNCNTKSEKCVDLAFGYECVCGEGYKLDGNKCIPICTQGCVRGECTAPNICTCDFGYVGANCSIQCQCNGHSECTGPDKVNECTLCLNNTMGAQCDKCKPLFVGDPRDNGECIPCSVYCHNHTDVCVGHDAPEVVNTMLRDDLEKFLQEGPLEKAICLRCSNNTDGDQCEDCITGHFRGTDQLKDICRPCECHGHGDTCDPVTGEKCNCGNNTESDATCSASSSKNSAQQCWMVQCSKCRDSYAGNPTDGHQCYKQITVESKMCFDAKTIDECKKKPDPLKPGQTVFFVVQPRFMNVDIRIIIDVTEGEVDLFLSPQDDSFVVLTNHSTNEHVVYLDHRYIWNYPEDDGSYPSMSVFPHNSMKPFENDSQLPFSQTMFHDIWRPNIQDCKTSRDPNGFQIMNRRAQDLSTYVTLHECNTLLRVYKLRNRLVLTLPQTSHNLSATRFFMALKASTMSASASYGLIFFRQDQLHIDLFVFFSVFFSCFFLFLAMCVVVWKAKQEANLRRDRRRHVVERQYMARRPFASICVWVNGDLDPLEQRRRMIRQRFTGGHPCHQPSELRLVSIEPTADGTAAVGTVLVRLPGRYRAPVTMALASSLVVPSRQHYSISGRGGRRNRATVAHMMHQQQMQPQPQQILPQNLPPPALPNIQ